MICKVRYYQAPPGNAYYEKPWVVEKYEGKTLVSAKYYKKVFFKRPVESDGPVLITKAGMIVESENGDVVSLEF